jgi:hypothetical protein
MLDLPSNRKIGRNLITFLNFFCERVYYLIVEVAGLFTRLRYEYDTWWSISEWLWLIEGESLIRVI